MEKMIIKIPVGVLEIKKDGQEAIVSVTFREAEFENRFDEDKNDWVIHPVNIPNGAFKLPNNKGLRDSSYYISGAEVSENELNECLTLIPDSVVWAYGYGAYEPQEGGLDIKIKSL